MDMNDRALRDIVVALGGVPNGFPRQSGFDITVASEVMAIFCLSSNIEDLQRRLGNIVIGYTSKRKPVYSRDLKADGAMMVLLKDAFMPNLVQTLENNPAFIHGGPFANIAHGCNSVLATKTALKLADYVVTEAGFGADLGAEKFFDIKCRKAGLRPDATVIVATIRALKMHGGVSMGDLNKENVRAVRTGCKNLVRHIENVHKYNVPVIVAINRFLADTDAEVEEIREAVNKFGIEAIIANHWAEGSAGIEELATKVADLADADNAPFKLLYEDSLGLFEKINIICRELYGAQEAIADKKIRDQLRRWEIEGYGHFPVCMAKTQYSFSTDPQLKGAPSGHVVPIRDVRLSAGAEFVVVICGEIMTMPGLPRDPAANRIRLNEAGLTEGLF
jgi:formate--tetrahydrofolate ligase